MPSHHGVTERLQDAGRGACFDGSFECLQLSGQ
jgi:hypothetical protein